MAILDKTNSTISLTNNLSLDAHKSTTISSNKRALYNDINAINQIKSQGNEQQGLEQAAEHFEAMFLQMVLKSMRSAADAFAGEESLTSSEQQKVYRDMYDGQLAAMMTEKGKLGIKEAMVRQLSPQVTSESASNNENGQIKAPDSLKKSEQMVADNPTSAAFYQPLLNLNKH